MALAERQDRIHGKAEVREWVQGKHVLYLRTEADLIGPKMMSVRTTLEVMEMH